MIIVGDIASPSATYSAKLKNIMESNPKVFQKQAFIFNFEGMIEDNYKLDSKKSVIFNHSSLTEAIKGYCPPIALLANNHILDLPGSYDNTINLFKSSGINYSGVGREEEKDVEIFGFQEDGINIYIINACWNFLLYHQKKIKRGLRVQTINERLILNKVRNIKEREINSKVIVYFHWGFDLEIIPIPRHRTFAKLLIDYGADIVVGSHSHCVQGGEFYKGRPIVYGLGNFFFPSGVYLGGILNFPTWSRFSLALEWKVKDNLIINHWFKESGQNSVFNLDYVESSAWDKCVKMNNFSPYAGMTDNEYVGYYKKNRRKRKFVPILKYTDNDILHFLKYNLLVSRARFARMIANLGLRNWQN